MTAKTSDARQVAVWTPDLQSETRADGTTLIWRADALGPYPDRLTDRIDHWAAHRPNMTWMAERDGEGWRKVTYRDLSQIVRRVGQWLLDQNLSTDRPLVILSRNSLEHAMIALSAQYVGVPSAAISPAYSLISTGYEKLHSIVAQITPGAVFVQDAKAFTPCITATLDASVPVISVSGTVDGYRTTKWPDAQTNPSADVQAAHDAIGPDTVAKFLFTSGTTGSPKAVIQTNRMLCANQEMVLDCFAFMKTQPPVFCDWSPWNHTASGNKVFNMALYHGGTFYIDGGKPTPAGMQETIRNLREVSPTWYFNVPAGYDALVSAMENDPVLRSTFFRDLNMLMYAGAGLASHTWTRLEDLAVETIGHKVLISTGLGATETAPFSLFCTTPQDQPGNVGIPARGVTMKLVPQDDKLEVRLKGPNITPGYWRAPELTAAAFDDEGYYLLGDALRYAQPDTPSKGFFFDGRIAENFKLRTGTWVAVGALRAQIVNQLGGLVSDAVIVGEDRDRLTALLIPAKPALAKIAVAGATDLTSDSTVHAEIAQRLADHVAASTGSATRITGVMLLSEPLSLDRGEVTDKGSVNQKAVLRHRQDLVERLYATGDPDVILPFQKDTA
jgi:feruloyl-CoA synthase